MFCVLQALTLKPFDDEGGYLLRSAPDFRQIDPKRLFKDLLSELAEHGTTSSLEEARDRVVDSMACHAAVRFGDDLTREEMQRMLDKMDETDAATHCPHGRPVYQIINNRELERRFKRH